jgi:hypothetical protein
MQRKCSYITVVVLVHVKPLIVREKSHSMFTHFHLLNNTQKNNDKNDNR